MSKQLASVVVGAALLLSGVAGSAQAMEGHRMKGSGAMCAMSGRGMKGCQEGGCPITQKLMSKAHFYLEHKADLSLTEQQISTIKAVKLQAEVNGIRQGADMKIFMIELQSRLGEDAVDAAGLNALIDQNTAAIATTAKAQVEAYAKLKSVLTADQLAKVKALRKNAEDQWKKGFDKDEGEEEVPAPESEPAA